MQSPEQSGEQRFEPTPESEMDPERRLRVLLNQFIEEKFYVGSDGYYWYDLLVYDDAEGPASARVVVEKTRFRALSITPAGLSLLAKGDIWGISDFFSELFDRYRAETEPNNDLRTGIQNKRELFEVYLRVQIVQLFMVARGDSFTVHGERYVVLGKKGREVAIIGNENGEQRTVTGMLIADKDSFRQFGKQ